MNDGDTIQTAYLGYKPEIILYSSQKKELTINLTPEIFDLNGVVVSSKNDRSLFKKMLKWGLEESIIYIFPIILILLRKLRVIYWKLLALVII